MTTATKFNPTYRKKALEILDEHRAPADLHFSLSAPAKIAGARKLAWSLPAGPDFTCPGATPACKDCYAQKGRHIFSNVQNAFIRNWLTLDRYKQAKDRLGAASALLHLIPSDAPLFRIHESGDFENQFAVDVWTEITKARPSTSFWFYTRSFKLNFEKLVALPNVEAWASTDNYNKAKADAFAIKYKVKQAYGPWAHDAALPANSFVCPVTSGKLGVDKACSNCKLCVVKGRTAKNVVFLGH